MKDIYRNVDVSLIPAAEERSKYVYVILNDAGKVKIGVSHDINKRYLSLCGSNGQGNTIISLYCSQPTYMYVTMERLMHEKFDEDRIPNTEWFSRNDNGIALFDEACEYLNDLFNAPSYETCNRARQNIPYGRRRIA